VELKPTVLPSVSVIPAAKKPGRTIHRRGKIHGAGKAGSINLICPIHPEHKKAET
jgi:hypothetical protein